MTGTKLVISLESDEIAALQEMAKSQRRSPARQAEVLVLAGIGMTIEKAGGHYSRWTDKELVILYKRTDLSDADLGIFLGRTRDAVSARRHRLGLKKHAPKTEDNQ